MGIIALFKRFLKITIFLGFASIIPLLVFTILQEAEHYYPVEIPQEVAPAYKIFPFFNEFTATSEEKDEYAKAVNEEYRYRDEKYKAQRKVDSVSFSILLVLSILFIIIAILITEFVIYSGILVGAILTILFGFLRYTHFIPNLMHSVVLFAGLLLLVFLTYRFLFELQKK